VTRHVGPIGKAEAAFDDVRGQLRNWMLLPEKIDGLLSRIEEGNVSFTATPSRLPIVAGSMLAAGGGAYLAWSLAHDGSNATIVLAAILMGFGFILSLSNK